MQDSNSYSQRLHIITASILAIIGNKRCCLVLLSCFDLFFFMRKMTKLKKFRGILPKSLKTSFFLVFFFCVGPATLWFWHRKRFFYLPFTLATGINPPKRCNLLKVIPSMRPITQYAVFFIFPFENNSEAFGFHLIFY